MGGALLSVQVVRQAGEPHLVCVRTTQEDETRTLFSSAAALAGMDLDRGVVDETKAGRFAISMCRELAGEPYKLSDDETVIFRTQRPGAIGRVELIGKDVEARAEIDSWAAAMEVAGADGAEERKAPYSQSLLLWEVRALRDDVAELAARHAQAEAHESLEVYD